MNKILLCLMERVTFFNFQLLTLTNIFVELFQNWIQLLQDERIQLTSNDLLDRKYPRISNSIWKAEKKQVHSCRIFVLADLFLSCNLSGSGLVGGHGAECVWWLLCLNHLLSCVLVVVEIRLWRYPRPCIPPPSYSRKVVNVAQISV